MTSGVGLFVAVAPGKALVAHSVFGPSFLRLEDADETVGPLEANRLAANPIYIFAVWERTGTHDSSRDGVPKLLSSDNDTLDGAILLASVTTNATNAFVTDRRVYVGANTEVADGSISTAKLAAKSITNAKVADNAGIDATKIGGGTVSNAEFAALKDARANTTIQAQIDALPDADESRVIAQDAFEAGQNISFEQSGNGRKTINATGQLAPTLERGAPNYTTPMLAPGATHASGILTMGRAAWVLRVSSNRPAWIRLYTTVAARTHDAARAMDVPPGEEHGLVFDVVTTAGNTTIDLAPMAQAANLETPPVPDYPLSVRNLDGTAGTVTVSVECIRIQI